MSNYPDNFSAAAFSARHDRTDADNRIDALDADHAALKAIAAQMVPFIKRLMDADADDQALCSDAAPAAYYEEIMVALEGAGLLPDETATAASLATMAPLAAVLGEVA